MQSVSSQFTNLASGQMRPLKWRLFMSMEKQFDEDINFFTLDESELDAGHFLQGTGDVVQEWDKYLYEDLTDRVISIEWQREETLPFSLAMAIADITLDNHDDLFTPGSGGAFEGFILPRRPIRIFAGFGNEAVPVFIGLNESMPEVDHKSKTVRFHCIDFLSHIYSRPLTESVIYENLRVDEILDGLLTQIGLNPMQYELDVAFSTVKFGYFEKETKFGDAVRKLMEAEMGIFSMDENGVLRFKNRLNFDDTPVFVLEENNVIDIRTRQQNELINMVEVRANVREVQPIQIIFSLAEPILVPGNDTVEKFFNYDDPVTSVTAPLYTAFANDDGTGSDLTANISVFSQENFSKASKIVFANSSATPAYITNLTINGTPAKVTKEIFVTEVNQPSIDLYDEQILTIDNDYIQSESEARSLALLILSEFSTFGAIYEVQIKGHPALQLSDQVESNLSTENTDYAITSIQCVLGNNEFRQILRLRSRQQANFFTLDESELDGGDLVAP